MTNETIDAASAIARVADLELVARIIVEGLVSGLHRSPFHGYSAEFSQYRHYRHGDDLKYVDWKLVARTDRIYTKQFRETTNTSAAIVLDTSRSMAFPESGTLPSKFRCATVSAAALAYLISSQGDAVGLVAPPGFLPPRSGRQQLRRLLGTASALRPGGVWQPAQTLRLASERLGRRGLLLFFSDLYDREEETFTELRRAARMGHEVMVFQVVSREEIEFSYRKDVEFVDLETGRTLAVDASQVRRDYTDAFAAFLETWRRRAASEGFQYTLMVNDAPIDRTLRNCLVARQTRSVA